MNGFYRARDSKLQRDIAIKALSVHLTSDAIASGGDSTARSNSNARREEQSGAGNGGRARRGAEPDRRGPRRLRRELGRALRRFGQLLLEIDPRQQRVEPRAQGLPPVREAVVHPGRHVVMNKAPHDAISFHLA